MAEEIPAQVQHTLVQLQQYQQQAQSLTLQRQQIEIQLAELDAALEALKEVKDSDVFRSVGPVLVKQPKTDIEKSLSELKETLDLRLKIIQKQEGKVKDKMKELSDKLMPFLKSQGLAE